MSHVLGIGGIFLKCQNLAATRHFYGEILEIPLENWGAQFYFRNDDRPKGAAYSVLSFFKKDSEYLAPSTQPFMINLRVQDFDGLLFRLKKMNISLVGTPISDDFGRFAWVLDPEGNKVELWEPPI
jgi:predicted enzyme related to lactoylglutathione lyase